LSSHLWKWPFRKLNWGETPWDDLPREYLVREVQRMYAALVAARGPLKTGQRSDARNRYWERGGVGGDAIEKVEQALSPYFDVEHAGGGYEPAYHSFFRYAVDLLFDGCGSGWAVCDRGDMVGLYGAVPRPSGAQRQPVRVEEEDGRLSYCCPLCRERDGSESPMRLIQWSDLTPRRSGD